MTNLTSELKGSKANVVIVGNPDSQVVKWLLNSVERLIGDIYSIDLINEGFFSVSDIENPTEEIIKRLFEESDLSIKKHRQEPQRTKHNVQKNGVKGFLEQKATLIA